MQKNYQDAADQLEKAVEEVIASLRKEMVEAGLNIDNIAKQPMAVEVVSFLLAKCLTDERLAFNFHDRQQAHKDAINVVKAAVIQYRGANLVPPSKHLIH